MLTFIGIGVISIRTNVLIDKEESFGYKEITVDVWRKPNEEVRVIQEEAEGQSLLVVHVFDSAAPLDLSQKSDFLFTFKNQMIN